ncbi:MAG: hypothetical protein KAR42_06990 [candidate division Zixibacteria bacterium]|nr:hypothetical protein [candidate division Zixibacteria bacterium]
MPQIVSVVFIIVGIGLLYNSFVVFRKFRLIKDIPRSTIRSMAMGIVELHGKVKSKIMLTSPFAKKECVYFKYTIEELRRSGSGKNRTTKWVPIGKGERHKPFYALDNTGEVLVIPNGADFNIDLKHEYRQRSGFFGGFKRAIEAITNLGGYDQKELLDISSYNLNEVDKDSILKFYSVGDRRYREYYLQPDYMLFVIGTAAHETNEKGRMLIRKGNNNPTFIIADKSEEGLLKALKKGMIMKSLGGTAMVVIGLFVLLKFTGNI